MHERLSDWWGGVSLRTKITGVTVLLVTLGLLVAGVGTMTALRSYLLAQVDSNISSAAREVTTITSTGSSTCEQNSGPNKFFFAVLDADGNPVCTNINSTQPKPVLRQLSMSSVLEAQGKPTTVWDSTRARQWRVVAFVGNVEGSATNVTVVVGESLDASNATISQFTVIFLGFGLSVVILGAALTTLEAGA